jgi:hypothetical protein
MELGENRAADAAELMKPFMQAEVTESDQAYIIELEALVKRKFDEE